ncbi:MAG: hypothetical protein ACRCWI_02285 [Brevinema sp.]
MEKYFTKEDIQEEAKRLYQSNPRVRKSLKNMFKVISKDKTLKGISISSQGKEVIISREDIDQINRKKGEN